MPHGFESTRMMADAWDKLGLISHVILDNSMRTTWVIGEGDF